MPLISGASFLPTLTGGSTPWPPGPHTNLVFWLQRNSLNCLGNFRNAIKKNALNFVGVGIGGQGVESPVRKNLALAPLKGDIKVRSG